MQIAIFSLSKASKYDDSSMKSHIWIRRKSFPVILSTLNPAPFNQRLKSNKK